jgi:hypothetical protein
MRMRLRLNALIHPDGPRGPRSEAPIEAQVQDDDGKFLGGIILWLSSGYLDELEIWSIGDPIREFPRPACLAVKVVHR